MPHMLFGLLRIRFLSLFGYSAAANLAYAGLNVAGAMLLFHLQHGIEKLPGNGIFMGASAMILIYLLTGRFVYQLFQRNA